MIQHNFAILECKKCKYRSCGAILSKRYIKDKISDGMVVCPKCDGKKIAVLDAVMIKDPERADCWSVYYRWEMDQKAKGARGAS